MLDIDEKDVLDGEDLKELYKWIDAVPSNRPKRNIARDFSDGVCVAEIIYHYLPRAVDLHNYGVVSATGQKRINWITLNRKVFSKLNIKLSDATITHVVEAKPGAIEQVLWDLRRKIQQYATTSTTNINVKQELSFSKSKTGNAPSLHAINTIVAPKGSSLTMQSSHVQVTPRPPPPIRWTNSNVNAKPKTPAPSSHVVPKIQPKVSVTQLNRQASNVAPSSVSIAEFKRQPSIIKPLTVSPESKISPDKSGDALILTEKKELTFSKSGGELSDMPTEIVFRGHKMVAVEVLESKDREIKELENSKKQLAIKIDRMQKLVVIKDERIDQLTHELSNLRKMFENATNHIVKFEATSVEKIELNNND